ncbi:MAG: PQQ-dependent sugar dehydrogenase [Bacteroidota bacterium]|jgi:glucose/arabinose dehydrogenase
MKRLSILTISAFCIAIGLTSCNKEEQNEKPAPIIPADTTPVSLVLDTLLTNLDQPWGMAILPDGGIITLEKRGVMKLTQNGNTNPITGLPAIRNAGQGGLMDIALHPEFNTNKFIYFTATTDMGSGYSTALYRAQLEGTSLLSLVKLFQSTQINTSSVHFGSRIVFDKDGKLYVCLGERNETTQSQNLSSHAGKVIRLNDDGSVPTDNPFVNHPTALKDVFSYGHRNPQGMAMHPVTGQLWLHEHGPRGGDEINLLQAGANYGWPLASFGVNYNGTPISKDTAVEGTLQPIYYWVPSIAPCGMDFYQSDSIPQWKGKLFIGALAGQHLNITTIENNKVIKEERILQAFGRFRCVKAGPDGYLYFLTESPGLLCRFKPKR